MGNEYNLAATARPGALKFIAATMSVQLRVPEPNSSARYLIELRQGDTWVDLQTTAPGGNILVAHPPQLGTVAIVQTD